MNDTFPEGLLPEIAKFLAAKRDSGEDLYDAVFDTEHFFPLQRKEELREMVKIAKKHHPRVVMEIGADKGGSVYHWCKCLWPKKVAACEVRGTPYMHLFAKAFPHINFAWLPCSSRDGVALQAMDLWLASDTIDVLFIDGEKACMLDDFREYERRVSVGGVVFVHDIQDDYGRRAFNAAKSGRRSEEIVLLQDSVEAEAREREGLPCRNSYEQWLRHWKGKSCGVGVVYL